MATYVLVHGAWHGSWCWKRVRKALQTAGHEVLTPTLTGVGERSHLNSASVNLSTHIADVANVIRWEELSDVILCGHSYGGCVISGAADRVPDSIRALVYLDAFVLEDGEALIDLLPPEQVHGMRERAQDTGDGWKVDPIPAEAFRVNADDSAWVNRQCTPQALATFEERIKLRGGLGRIRDVTHILATGYVEESPFPACHERAKKKGRKTRTIPCGHDAMLDLPDELNGVPARVRLNRAAWARADRNRPKAGESEPCLCSTLRPSVPTNRVGGASRPRPPTPPYVLGCIRRFHLMSERVIFEDQRDEALGCEPIGGHGPRGGCRSGLMAVSDYQAGKVVATLPIGTGVDGAGYDAASGNAFSSKPDQYHLVENVQTPVAARNMGLDPAAR